MDYRKTAQEILNHVGGSKNIVSAAHCATRLRLVITDNTKADKTALENVDGVKGVFEASGQLQIILGTGTVNKVFDEFIAIAGITASTKAEAKEAAAEKQNWFMKAIKLLGDIFVPIIPAIVASSFLDEKKEPVAEAPVTVAASVEKADSEESAASETKTASDNTKTTSSEEVLNAPVNGKIIPNDQIADDTFAAEFLGKTVAIEPADGIITAPCDGEIVSIFKTGHAVCILTDGGAELLIHIGIDTVKMDGNGFTKKVSDGAKVHAGDVLIEADLNAIKEAGHPATTMMILTNTDLYDSVECAAPGTVTGKSSVMKLTK